MFMANYKKHSGLQRGQTERPPRDEGGTAAASSSSMRPPPGLEQLSPVSYTRPTSRWRPQAGCLLLQIQRCSMQCGIFSFLLQYNGTEPPF